MRLRENYAKKKDTFKTNCYNLIKPFGKPNIKMNNKKRISRFIITLVVIALVACPFLYAILYSTSKAGFGLDDKTFMYWVELIIIPVTLAIAVYVLNKYDKERETERATDQKREDAIQHYIDKITEIIRTNTELSEQDLTAIKIRTLTVLRMLDGDRKGFIVKFLYEIGLIANKDYISRHEQNIIRDIKPATLSLVGADLRNVNLENADFWLREEHDDNIVVWKIDLSGADLSNANLSGALMNGANFTSSILKNANLTKLQAMNSNFIKTNFSFANLTNANLANSWFNEASLQKTKCKGTSFYGSYFFTSLISDFEPLDEGVANFSGAELTYTNFSEAKILPNQLKHAKHIWKIYLPYYGLYSGLHPLFSIEFNVPTVRKAHLEVGADGPSAICGCGKTLTVDIQKIIDEKTEQATEKGLLYVDEGTDILKAFWAKYASHQFDFYARNGFTKFIYILTEFHPTGYAPKDNFLQRYIRTIFDGIRFWQRYKETDGFTKSRWNPNQDPAE